MLHARLATLALAALPVFGCAIGVQLPRAPSAPEMDPSFAAAESVTAPGVDNDPPTPFVLLPGDVVRMRTLSSEPLDVDALSIDPAGWIDLPLAGSVAVGGLRLSDASSRIESAFHRYDRFARVVMTVTDAGGHRATVLGVVEHPGMYPVRAETRVADLVALSGGPRSQISEGEAVDTADIEGAHLIREGLTVPISVSRALEGDVRHNIRVRPGDMLLMPPSRGQRVSVLGSVHTAKSIPFRRGLRLSDALAMAGGPTEDADQSDVRVIRGPLSRPRIYRASIADLIAGQATDVMLMPGDVVFVTEHWFATASRVVARLSPLLTMGALAATVVR